MIGKLLHKCNVQKEKGAPVLDIFKYKLCNIFSGRSMYMQQRTGSYRESFSKNTFYRFLNNAKANWMRLQKRRRSASSTIKLGRTSNCIPGARNRTSLTHTRLWQIMDGST